MRRAHRPIVADLRSRAEVGGFWPDQKSREEILNVAQQMMQRRKRLARAIDKVGHVLAHPGFFAALLAAHVLWILLNVRIIPGVEPWDPYPFMFLATLASVEAPFIALLVLMRQRREARIAEIREELQVQVSLHIEREVTEALRLLHRVAGKERLTEEDRGRLRLMEQTLQPAALMDRLRRRLDEIEGKLPEEEAPPAAPSGR